MCSTSLLRLLFSSGLKVYTTRQSVSLYLYVTKTQCRNQVATTGGHIAPELLYVTREHTSRATTNYEVARRRYFRRIGILHHADATSFLIEIIATFMRQNS